MTYEEPKNAVKKTIKKIKKGSYLNIMNYAYKTQNTRKIKETISNRRKNQRITKIDRLFAIHNFTWLMVYIIHILFKNSFKFIFM